jgi:hypothetical protein
MVSPATAKTHVTYAMVKLGGRYRARLVVLPTSPAWSAPAGSANPPPLQLRRSPAAPPVGDQPARVSAVAGASQSRWWP